MRLISTVRATAIALFVVTRVTANLKLDVAGDDRRIIDLGAFGFAEGGQFRLKVDHFFCDPPVESFNESMGFVLDKVRSAQYARLEQEYAKTEDISKKVCFVDDSEFVPDPPSARFQFSLLGKNHQEVVNASYRATITIPGSYALFFYNCLGFNRTGRLQPMAISFSAFAEEYNVNANNQRNYLGVGQQALPVMYTLFSLAFVVLSALWGREIRNNAAFVHPIHRIMLALVVLKTLSIVFETFKFSHYASTGQASMWDALYYLFLTAKGMMLFAVLVLLGSGWSILKAYLSEQDKKLLMVVVPAQVLINICIAVIEESNEGMKNWGSWVDLLRILDVLCCCCVLLPIVWSIKNLREAAELTEKAAMTLSRMRQFRTFYVVVVAYIYFTRIIVVMIQGALPWNRAWLARFLTELSAVAFYFFAGKKFRPMKENPYLNLQQEDLDELQHRREVGEDRGSPAEV